MPELIEQMYSSQQIVIPPKYPYILKRYCKAAIKTQPYDLLRWSFEYFKALSEHRPPPVKLRLEYPVYSTEGGLTRGCLKVLAHQLSGMVEIPTSTLRQAWNGFCLDYMELQRILCLCEVYQRKDHVPFFNFLAVAGGMLTKCLTHTMILLCESLTKEPDGGSAAIPVEDFITMYKYLALIDASKDVQYHNGHREGNEPHSEIEEEEETPPVSEQKKLKHLSTTKLQESGMLKSGMVAGRQMSTTSGEFIVQHIEHEIMAYIDEQIAILPDPDLKKKKAKPEEVAMVRDILETFLDENMDIIIPEVEEVEEEEVPIPDIIVVYAVPGIGPPVDSDIMADFEEYIREVTKVQADMVMPRNIRHFLCPPLEKYIETDYEPNEKINSDQVPVGGTIAE